MLVETRRNPVTVLYSLEQTKQHAAARPIAELACLLSRAGGCPPVQAQVAQVKGPEISLLSGRQILPQHSKKGTLQNVCEHSRAQSTEEDAMDAVLPKRTVMLYSPGNRTHEIILQIFVAVADFTSMSYPCL